MRTKFVPGLFADIPLALFATQMFHNLGVGWAGSLLGFLAVAFMPIPFLFYIFGARLRKLSKNAPTDLQTRKQKPDDEESKSEKSE